MNTSYLGNPLLKKSNVPINFTKEQVEEYMKCAADPIHFISTHMMIVSLDEGLINFSLYDFQKTMVETFYNNRFTIVKCPRQSGKSITIIAYLLHYILFNENMNIAILANKGQTARDLLGRLQLAYENLPPWLQQGVIVWNKGSIELENGSKILAAATSSSAVRGGTFNIIFLDEFAFVPHNIADQFFRSVYPTISSGETTKVLIVSTPNGLNHFYKMWMDSAEGRSDYIPIDVHWSEVPGRDESWKEETIRNTSPDQFRIEFECDFIGSAQTLISASKLRNLSFVEPIFSKNDVNFYNSPEKEKDYMIAVDSSKGIGHDNSAFVVIDVTDTPYKLVAKYQDNTISPLIFPSIIASTAKYYNEATVLIESNGVGSQVADILYHDLEYDNVIWSTKKGRKGQVASLGWGKGAALGISTSFQVKAVGCATLKDLLESDKLIVEDYDIISELQTFIQRRSSYEAEEGHNDDLVMALVMFAWLSNQKYFKDLLDQDIRLKVYDKKISEIENEVLPFGFINSGNEEEVIIDTNNQRWEIAETYNQINRGEFEWQHN